MRYLLVGILGVAACSGGSPPGPAAAARDANQTAAGEADEEPGSDADSPATPKPGMAVLDGEGELPPGEVAEPGTEAGTAEGEVAALPDDDPRKTGDAPPGVGEEQGQQPVDPGMDAAAPQAADLSAENLEQAREQAMSEREKRIARAAAAKNAYEQ